MYSYENYAIVKEEIAARRQKAIADAEKRKELLRLESPEIEAIDKELSGTGFLLFKAACRGEDIAPIKEKNLCLQKKKKEIILSLGYPEDYTEVKHFCPACSDTGYTENGAVCSCLREALIKATISSSGMGKLIDKQSFDNFDLSRYDPTELQTMKRTLRIAKEYAENFSRVQGDLLLFGKTGTGKTHISSAIAREVIRRGFDVIYDSVQNILNDYENEKFKSGYGQKDYHCERYVDCDLLIIDDLGTEFSSPFTLSCLYNLLNTRQNRSAATIISTNLSFEELAKKYEDRIYSRIFGKGSTILSFVGKDYRIHGK